MGKHFQLLIDDPCHENRDKMTPAEKGRFCASCQKQVIDFTNMSDSQLAAFFKRSSSGSVCGRFYEDQLQRDIEIPRKRIPWVKYFFQFALPAFLVSMKATAQGKVKAKITSTKQVTSVCTITAGFVAKIESKPLIGDTVLSQTKKQPDLISIKGTVIDEDNNPVSNATIIIKGTKIGTLADGAGAFEIKSSNTVADLTLWVSSVGYEPQEVQITRGKTEENLVVRLTAQVMGEVVVVGYTSRKIVSGVTGAVSVVSKKITETPAIKSPEEILPMIKVYPNPVRSGTNINIGCQKLHEGYYTIQLFTQSGQQVLNKQTWIDDDIQVLNIDIPDVPTGVYFVRLTNKETGKRFTQKIVIE